MRKARTWVGIATGVLGFHLSPRPVAATTTTAARAARAGRRVGDLTGSLNISGSSTVEPDLIARRRELPIGEHRGQRGRPTAPGRPTGS